MTLSTFIRNRPGLIIVSAMIVSLAGLFLLPPLLQDQGYHRFADQRELFGIPNFWNVVSNLPFVAVGAAGLWQFHRHPATIVLFSGMILTGVGSSYYHLNPSDASLVWDRLPMTLCFAAILAAAIDERVHSRAGLITLVPLVVIGIASILLWRWTDDLRLYAWTQFFAFFALLGILRLFEPRYTGASYWMGALALYALAKLFEFYDAEIFSAGEILSGHTLKHFAAAAASFVMLKLFQNRRPLGVAMSGD